MSHGLCMVGEKVVCDSNDVSNFMYNKQTMDEVQQTIIL